MNIGGALWVIQSITNSATFYNVRELICISNRVGPLVGDQEATQISINYMHDIVLEISFLDLNNGPNLSPSNLKFWKEMLITQKGVIRYQIFLHVVDRHEKTDFFC